MMIKTILAMLVIASFAISTSGQAPEFTMMKFSDMGTTLQAQGSVVALGNDNIDIFIEAEGVATIECWNGDEVIPKQNTTIWVTGNADNLVVKNGRTNFILETSEPDLGFAPMCPDNWTAIVTDMKFSANDIINFSIANNANNRRIPIDKGGFFARFVNLFTPLPIPIPKDNNDINNEIIMREGAWQSITITVMQPAGRNIIVLKQSFTPFP